MSGRNKLHAVKRLMEGLSLVSATDLEHIAIIVVSLITGKEIIHRGVNEDDKPVGYTIDGFDSENVLVVECSTEKSYFNSSSKIKNDINHSKSKAPRFEKIYLISNQNCPEDKWSTILEDVDNVKCEIFDDRRLSETIYNQLCLKDTRIDMLSVYLPTLTIIRDESIFDFAVPVTSERFFIDLEVTRFMEEVINSSKIIYVYGISGSGKTSATIEYASRHFIEYDKVVWVDYKDIEGRSFYSIVVSRLGHTINLVHSFTSCKCLLVIDDCNFQVDNQYFRLLKDGFDKGSKIIILSKLSCNTDIEKVQFPMYSDEIAQQMLLDGITISDKSSLVHEIITKSTKNPFMLRFINSSLINGDLDWTNVIEVFSSLNDIQTASNEFFIRKLLNEFSAEKQGVMRQIAWLRSQFISSEFLMKFLNPVVVSNLQRNLIISKTSDQYFKVHDLVMLYFMSIEKNIVADEECSFTNMFWNSIFYIQVKHPYHFHNCLSLFSSRLQVIVRALPKTPSKHLAVYLQMEECDVGIIESISKLSLKNYAKDIESVMCIIEANESQLISANNDERVLISKRLIEEIDSIVELTQESDKARLRHHKAKAFVRLHKFSEAWDIFIQNQRCNQDDLSTSLQIARLAHRMYKDNPEEEYINVGSNSLKVILNSVMDSSLRKTKSVTYQIESMKLLSRYRDIEEEYARNEVFINAAFSLLMHCLIAGNKQAFEGLVPFSRMTWFEFPEVLVTLAEYADFPLVSSIEYQSALNIADALKNIGKAYKELHDSASMNKWCTNASKYYDHPRIKIDSYQITMIAENQIILGKYDDAQENLDRIPADQRNAFWFYRQAQIEFDTFEYTSALESINRALSSSVPEKFKPAFFKLQGDIYSQTKQYDLAMKSYSTAILVTSSNKFALVLKDAIENLPVA